MRLVRMTSRSARGGSSGPARRSRLQRCAVRVTYCSNRTPGQWYAHGRYIEREGGAGEIASTLAGWQKAGDERMFKIIVSPEFGERMDLEQHARDLMAQMSRDLGVPLEWVSAVHRNTDHPHIHIALRGSGGLRLPPEYIKHGLRQRAEELCTAQLGYRTDLDIQESQRREVAAQHPTSLDRRIASLQPGAKADPTLTARLRTLQRMGLAKETAPNAWQVRPDFLSILRAMKKATDRQKMLAAHAAAISNPHLPIRYTPPEEITHLEGRVIGHSVDHVGVQYLILEATGTIHLIPQNSAIESARHAERLNSGNFVCISGSRPADGRPATIVSSVSPSAPEMNPRGRTRTR